MACNCSKKAKNLKWVYTDSKGVQQVYDSEVAANAAKIRDGHKGSVRSIPA